MANRPELEINQAQKDINALDQRYYKELKKPQIDLVASYSSSGIGGTQNPNFSSPFATPCDQNLQTPAEYAACLSRQQLLQTQQQALLQSIGGSSTSITDVLSNKYPTFRFGVQFNLPLFGDKTYAGKLWQIASRKRTLRYAA